MEDDEGLKNLKYFLHLIGIHFGSAPTDFDKNGKILKYPNYVTVAGCPRYITIQLMDSLGEGLFFADVAEIIGKGCDTYFWIPPELTIKGMPCLSPVVKIQKHAIHFMVRAFEYREMLKKRHRNCVETCIVLLRVAPFQQKDLRLWWVRNMVFPTWHNQVWEKNAE